MVNSALVVGDRGSGLTTFVGLLYAAQLRLGTEEQDEFRFSADRESIRQLEGIYGELVAGRFPEWDADWDTHPLSFVFAFRSGKFGRLGRGRTDRDGGFDAFRVRVGGISAEEVADLAEHDAVLEESTRQLLRSPVLLPLIDASRLPPRSEAHKHQTPAHYDRHLATTFDLVCRFLSTERGHRVRTLHPLFVVTKFDQCPAPTLAQLGVPVGPPAAWPSGAHEEVGRRILAEYYPMTTLFFERTRRERAATVAEPLWFYSSLQLAPDPAGRRIARRSRIPVGGWEPEYPFEEYRSLIEHLGALAHRLPDWADPM